MRNLHRGRRWVPPGGAVIAILMVTMAAGHAVAAAAPRFLVPSQASTGGTLPQHLAVADFDADGNTDIASANQGPVPLFGASIGVTLGDGAGGLSAPVTTDLPAGWGACDITAGRFDAGLASDVAVVSCTTGGEGPIFALTADGDGTFTVSQQIANSTDGQIVSADFDADGFGDLAFSARGSPAVRIYLGNGNGTFRAPTSYSPPFDSYDLAVGDVDDDGDPDLIGADGGPIWSMLNQGNGTFGAQAFDFEVSGLELAVADFNADGKDDAAVVDASGGHVTAALSLGDGHFVVTQQIGDVALQVSWVGAGDFTGDGRADLVADTGSNATALFPGRGDGTFGRRGRWVTAAGDVTAADLDGSGPADLVAFDSDPGTIYATVATPSGFRSGVLQPGPSSENPGDVNRDGRIDKVSGTPGLTGPGVLTSQVITQPNRGGGRFGPSITSFVREETASSGIGDIQLGDINEDGRLDVVGGFENFQPNPNNLFWMLGTGTGRFVQPTLSTSGDVDADILSLALRDVTGDGHLDIISHTVTQISVKPGDGAGSFGTPILSGYGSSSQMATLIADFTGDGLLDLLAAIKTGDEDFGSSDLRLEQGNGNGTFTLVQTRFIDSNVSEGHAADFNADGRPDVAVVGSRGSNGGRNALWIALTTAAGRLDVPTAYEGPAGGLAVGDFNLDGAPDVATNGIDTILLFSNAGNGTFPAVSSILSAGGVSTTADFAGGPGPDLLGSTSIGYFALYLNAI